MIGGSTTAILQKLTEVEADSTWSETWAAVATIYNCQFQPLTTTETLLLAKETVIATHKLWIGYDDISASTRTELTEKNRIQIASVNYNIVGVKVHLVLYRHYELLLEKIT